MVSILCKPIDSYVCIGLSSQLKWIETYQIKITNMKNTNSREGSLVDDMTVDLLIVGSGTGLSAALAGHEKGLKTMVIEKTAYVGGSTALSGGGLFGYLLTLSSRMADLMIPLKKERSILRLLWEMTPHLTGGKLF